MKTTKLIAALAAGFGALTSGWASPWLDMANGSYSQVDPNTISGTVSFLETGFYPNLAGPVKVTIQNLSGTGLTLDGVLTSENRTSLSGLSDAPPGLYPISVDPASGSILILSSKFGNDPLHTFRVHYDFNSLAGGGLPSDSFLYLADIDFPIGQERARVGPSLNWIGNFQMRDTASPENPGTYSTATLVSPGSYTVEGPASGDWGAHAFKTTSPLGSMDVFYEASFGAGAGVGIVGAVPEPSTWALICLGALGGLWLRKRTRR